MLNPFNAPTVMQGIFHRGFMDIHSGAAQLMGIANAAVFRGDGGEIERRPNKPTPVWTTHGATELHVEEWPQMLDDGHAPPDQEMDVTRLMKVWRGEDDDEYAREAIIGTMAVDAEDHGQGRHDGRPPQALAAPDLVGPRHVEASGHG